jgi:CheY-like chemotaxis protein
VPVKFDFMALQILLVENDKPLRRALAQLLKQSGYEVSEAENGRVAMQQMLRQPADLVITEMIMPEMDGVETILAVRRGYPGAKILAVSGGGMSPAENSLKIARTLGSHRTMAKPRIAQDFLRVVQELIG